MDIVNKISENNKIAIRTDLHLKYLTCMYDKAKIVSNSNDLEEANYINISVSKIENEDVPTLLHALASKLTLDNKIAVKMFKNENQIIIEVN